MSKYRVTLLRQVTEYVYYEVEAESEAEARKIGEATYTDDDDPQWELGDPGSDYTIEVSRLKADNWCEACRSPLVACQC